MSGFTLINVGAAANDGNGDSLRVSQQAVNANYISTVRALTTTSSLSTESAASGYVRLIYNDLGSQVFAADNSGLTVDNIRVFTSATVGWTWVRTTPAWVDITAPRFRCIGDDATDNTTNLQAAADYALETNLPLRIPAGTYKTTDFINFYDINIIGDGRDRSVIKSYATNKPVGVFNGSNFSIRDFGLRYDTLKTDKSCNAMLVTGYNASGRVGYYYGSVRDIALQYGCNGYKCPAELSTTLSASASSGATSIQVASVGSGTGQSILAGVYINVTLDTAAVQVVQVDYVSGATVYLKDALDAAATSGNAVTVFESVVFTNTFDNVYITYWTDFGFYHAGSGTGSSFPNLYLANALQDNYGACAGAIYISNFAEGFMGQVNVEWCAPTESLIQLNYGNGLDISSLRTEGIKPQTSGTGILQITNDTLRISTWTIDNLNVETAAGTISLVRFPTGTQTDRETRVDIGSLNIQNGLLETPSNVYYCQSNNATESLYIHSMGLRPDAGIRRRGQFATPSTVSKVIKKLDPFFDESVVAYGTKLDISFTGDKTMYSRTRRAGVEKVVVGNSRESLSTAVAGVNTATSGGGTDIATPEALSTITGYNKQLRLSVESGIENTIFEYTSDSKLYFEVATAQADVAVSGTSVSVQRYNDRTSGFGIQEYVWSGAHGLNIGDLVQTSGYTDTDFNFSTPAVVVAVPSSTTFQLYNYTGSSKVLTADTGGSLSKVPSVDVKIYGEDWERPNY